jgi:tetratricopeptide (TPR) repeat protein
MLPNNARRIGQPHAFAAVLRWLTALVGSSLLPATAGAADIDWQDVESRIQYGYYTEDVRAVRGVMDVLTPADSGDALRSYYAGLANYRLTLLMTAAHDKSHAKDAAQRCVSSLDRALEARKDFADALALQSACLEVVATLEAWKAPFAASKSGTQIEKARHLAPSNPRVVLLGAIEDYQRPKPSAADTEEALTEFKNAAAMFEAERKQTSQVPGWGAAEAYVFIARCYLDKGEALPARDALERALLIAPEFAQPHRLMAKITS